MKTKTTKNDFFTTHILPFLKSDLDDPSEARCLRSEWRRLEKIKGVQTLIAQGDTASVIKIFAACTGGC